MKIGLALGGGGVLGVAHIALLEELKNHDIEVSAITGTSAGAIIASLFAVGGLDLVKEFLTIVEERKILSRRNVFLAGKPDNIFVKIEGVLRELITEDNFNKTRIPLIIVATDIEKARSVRLGSGSIVGSVMASAAYPGVFPVQTINGRRLIDGGVTNNLPVDVLKSDLGCQFVIASSLNRVDIIDSQKKLSRAAVATRALDILLLELEKVQLAQADYSYLPPISEYRWYHYKKLDEIYQKSRPYAASIMPELKNKIASKKPKGFFARIFSS